jgi:uncharacterized protein
MALLSGLAGPLRYRASNPTGLAIGLMLCLVLALAYVVAQSVIGLGVAGLLAGRQGVVSEQDLTKATIIATLPAGLVAVLVGWLLAKVQGGNPRDVLALRSPGFSPLQWAGIILGFIAGIYALLTIIMAVFQIDPGQYTPGADGSSPDSGSAGLVKEAMFGIVREPRLFVFAFLSVAIGAPLAEEVIFRGQLFATLAQSAIGRPGAVAVTSALWALLHATEPWLTVGLIFVMGLVLGYLLLRFGSLWVTIACHGAWNATYSLIIFGLLNK